MSNFAAQRRHLVDTQLRPNDVTDLRILEAFDTTAREAFAPDQALVYSDHDVVVQASPRRYLQRATVLGKLMQAAAIGAGDSVLVVGAGTGYAAAVAAKLAGRVTALEAEPALADHARTVIDRLGLGNVTVVTGPVSVGAPAEGPYDVILVDGAVGALPPALATQLKQGGRLAVVEGGGLSGRARLYLRRGTEVAGRDLFNWASPVLPGAEAEQVFVF